MRFYMPEELPLSLFYYAWKKAKYFVVNQSGFYDPVDVKRFELNLDQNLLDLKESFENLFNNYGSIKGKAYFTPKASKDNNKRYRIMTYFNFKDQVAWAVAVLALADWFDTNDEIMRIFPIKDTQLRNIYSWMVPWSYNNRIKRVVLQDDLTDEHRRLYTHFNSKDFYESFQWGLRNLREERKRQFEKIRETKDIVYYGEADIKEFYPSLKISYIKEAIFKRLTELSKDQNDIHKEKYKQWEIIINNLCNFEIDYGALHQEPFAMQSVNDSLLGDREASYEELIEKLKYTLPINLISSGFLANCALTEFFDIRIADFLKKKCKENGIEAYITRYTDDIMIVSSNEKTVTETIIEIDKLLTKMELSLSIEKCKPKPFLPSSLNYDEDILDINIRNENITFQNRIMEYFKESTKKFFENNCPRVEKHDKIPGSTSVIEKLSQINEQTLWALNNKELERYLVEVLKLMEINFGADEIKDETKVAFTAWRARKGAEELLNRKLPISQYKINDILQRVIRKYPYKLSLLDYYVIHLFDRTKFENIIEPMEKLLAELKQKSEDEKISIGSYGAYVRTRFMYVIIHNWHLVRESQRKTLKGVIYEGILSWYKDEPIWHEKIAIYWLLIVLGINREPGIGNLNNSNSIEEMEKLFSISKMKNKEIDADSELFNSLILDAIKLRKSKNGDVWELDEDEEGWFSWRWDTLNRRVKGNLKQVHLRTVISLAKFNKDLIPRKGFELIIRRLDKGFISRSKENLKIFDDATSLVDSIIVEWIRNPNKKHVKNFLAALTYKNKNELLQEMYVSKPLRKYCANRIENIVEIIKVLKLLPIENISSLPFDIQNNIGLNKDDKKIPLSDWIAVTENLKYDKSRISQPLSELEIASLMLSIIEEIDDANYIYLSLKNLTVTIKDWKTWRENNLAEKFSSVNIELNVKNKILNEQEEILKKFIDEISKTQKDFSKCYVLSIILLRLLVKRNINKEFYKVVSLLRWKGFQEILKRTSFPSTNYVTLLSSTLNSTQYIFREFYKEFGVSLLPYKQMTKYRKGLCLNEYKKEITGHYNSLKQQYMTWDFGLIERITIDVDLIMGESGSYGNKR